MATAAKQVRETKQSKKAAEREFLNSREFTWDGQEWVFLDGKGLNEFYRLVSRFMDAQVNTYPGLVLEEWDLSRFHDPLQRTSRHDEVVFFRCWLDSVVNWEGYRLWNSLYAHLYAKDDFDKRKVSDTCDKVLREFQDQFR